MIIALLGVSRGKINNAIVFISFNTIIFLIFWNVDNMFIKEVSSYSKSLKGTLVALIICFF